MKSERDNWAERVRRKSAQGPSVVLDGFYAQPISMFKPSASAPSLGQPNRGRASLMSPMPDFGQLANRRVVPVTPELSAVKVSRLRKSMEDNARQSSNAAFSKQVLMEKKLDNHAIAAARRASGFEVDLREAASSDAGSAIDEQLETMHQKISILELHDLGPTELVHMHQNKAAKLPATLNEDNTRVQKMGFENDYKMLQQRCGLLMEQAASLHATSLKKAEERLELATLAQGKDAEIEAKEVASRFYHSRLHSLREMEAQLETVKQQVEHTSPHPSTPHITPRLPHHTTPHHTTPYHNTTPLTT